MGLKKAGLKHHFPDHRIAVEIRCSGGGGRCGRLRGLALALPPGGNTVLLLTTQGASFESIGGVLEANVPADFHGETTILFCADGKHNLLMEGGPTGESTWTSVSGRRVREGLLVVVVPAVWSRKPERRKAAYKVLLLLVIRDRAREK